MTSGVNVRACTHVSVCYGCLYVYVLLPENNE